MLLFAAPIFPDLITNEIAMMNHLIEMNAVNKSFGSLVVANDLTLHVEKGEALGIIGPNGAGKSTMFNLMAGVLRADSGKILFDGNDITSQSPHERCRNGIGRSYQIPYPFSKMTVFENLLVGAVYGTGKVESDCYEDCLRTLRVTGLLPKANVLAGSLTLLERKRLELARAMATKPKLLLLDEIAGGMTEYECGLIVETIKEIHSQGTTIIWIEHIVHALMSVVGRMIVLNFGAIIDNGVPAEVMNNPKVQEVYMGIDIK